MANRGDEFVLHALQAPPLRNILERHHHACNLAVLNERVGTVFHGNCSAILPPEHLIAQAHALSPSHSFENRAVQPRIRCTVGLAVTDQVEHATTGDLLRGIAQHPRSGFIDKRQPSVEVDSINAVSNGFQNQFTLPCRQVQGALGLELLGDIDAVINHEGPFSMQIHAAASESDSYETTPRWGGAYGA